MTENGKDETLCARWSALATGIIVLAFAMLVITGTVALNPFASSTQFRLLGDRTQLANALANEITDGDSLADVERLLGPWHHRKEKAWIEIQITSEDSLEFLRQYPQGIRPDDQFVAYHGTFQIVLQFRDGILINHNGKWLRQTAN